MNSSVLRSIFFVIQLSFIDLIFIEFFGSDCGQSGGVFLYASFNLVIYFFFYEGNLLGMNTDDSECIVLHAELNDIQSLLYALRFRFPKLDIEMKETAI